MMRRNLLNKMNKKTDHRIIKMWEHNGWGNSVNWMKWEDRTVYGFLSNPPKKGDILWAEMESGKIASFVFEKVDVPYDPEDQFFGTVSDAEYIRDN